MGNTINRDRFSARDFTFFVPRPSLGPPRAKQVAVVLGFACVFLFGLTAAFAQSIVTVGMTDSLRFDPQEVVIHTGDTVLWRNTSTIFPHTATSELTEYHVKGFNSGYLPRNWMYPGATFQFTFTTAGVFKYFCFLHKGFGMVGKITVTMSEVPSQYFFTAARIADEEQIVVRWNVARNEQRVGFRVLRSTGWDQQFVEVSDGIVKAESETAAGEEYQFVDTRNILGDTQYFYVLEEVLLNGQESFRGPAIANAR